ncbi:Src1p [Saccharomyces cerevisiae P283]|nr:Src1p [Saccharomyces cerevisiae P283]CAI4652130.1 AHG_G0040070.mRNA.1.CDS.1 [Saccharomyces cerevisiae]CAI6829356.1 AHG_G0040070.mRNA.1.CDS.1 [Saccharomyces cerevisiae]
MNSDLEYLEDGFDPNSMKVATLRRILVENNVDFPSNARKNALVGLFDEKVKPQIPQLRKMYLNVRPSDEGIVKMDRPSSSPSIASPRRSRRARREKSASPMAKQFKKNRILDDVSNDDDDDDDDDDDNDKKDDPLIVPSGTDTDEVDDEEDDVITSSSNKSDTNDFQQNSDTRKKRKDPDSDDWSESNSKENKIDNKHLNLLSSDSEIEQDYQKAKKRKTSDLNQEHGNGSAILGKLSVKTPIKNTNRKPVSMDNFNDSLTSSGTENDPFVPNIRHNPKELGTANGTGHSTPLRKLKVSASFADKLPQKEVPSTILVPEVEQQEPSQSERTPSLFSSEGSGSESEAPLLPEITTPGPHQPMGNTSNNVVEMIDTDSSNLVSDEDEVLVPTRIETPQLPTEKDVEKCEARVQELQEEVNEQLEHENGSEFDVKQGSGKVGNRHKFKRALKFLSKSLLALFLFCIFIVIPLLFGLWYREQRLLIGYCGHEVPSHRVSGNSFEFIQKLDNLLQDYRPKCIPCPPNGICYPYLKLKCKPDYKLAPSRLDFLEIIPAQGKCVKDDKKQQLVSEVVEKSLEFLRAKNAQISCGDGKDDIESGMTEDALYQIFNEARAPWIRDDEFEDLWIQVIKDLTEEPEILWRQLSPTDNNIGGNSNNIIKTNDVPRQKRHLPEKFISKTRNFRSTSKKYIGMKCRFEREIYQTYKKFQRPIWLMFLLIVISKVIEIKLKNYYRKKARIEELVTQTMEKLKFQKIKSMSDPKENAYLSIVQLRDIFLSDIVDLKYKNQLWSEVVKYLEHNNSNIKSNLTEIRGEIMKCWEWIGPMELNEPKDSAENKI